MAEFLRKIVGLLHLFDRTTRPQAQHRDLLPLIRNLDGGQQIKPDQQPGE